MIRTVCAQDVFFRSVCQHDQQRWHSLAHQVLYVWPYIYRFFVLATKICRFPIENYYRNRIFSKEKKKVYRHFSMVTYAYSASKHVSRAFITCFAFLVWNLRMYVVWIHYCATDIVDAHVFMGTETYDDILVNISFGCGWSNILLSCTRLIFFHVVDQSLYRKSIKLSIRCIILSMNSVLSISIPDLWNPKLSTCTKDSH